MTWTYRAATAAWLLACDLAACLVFLAPNIARADSLTFGAAKDNTLYEDAAGSLSNGAGQYFFAGRTGAGRIVRGLIAFDLSDIPPQSTINSVSLTLHASTPRATLANTVGLQRMLVDWGEADSLAVGGGGGEANGGPASTGDATWLHNISPGSAWQAPGGAISPAGDVSSVVSASLMVQDTLIDYAWDSTPGLVADVQGWVNNPATNFGWMLRAEEITNGSSKRFNSRQNVNPASWPSLLVDFTPPSGELIGDANGDTTVDRQDGLILAANFGASGAVEFSDGDFDHDGRVGLSDVHLYKQNFGTPSPEPPMSLDSPLEAAATLPTPVGEPTSLALLATGLSAAWIGRRRRHDANPSALREANPFDEQRFRREKSAKGFASHS